MEPEGADKPCGSTAANEQKDTELKEHRLPNDFPKGRMIAPYVAAGLLVHASGTSSTAHLWHARVLRYAACMLTGCAIVLQDFEFWWLMTTPCASKSQSRCSSAATMKVRTHSTALRPAEVNSMLVRCPALVVS